MSAPVIDRNFKTVEYTKHPSMTPLAKFQGHIVKTFSSLPSEGKFLEIVKRITIVAVSPFAYLALAFIGILGYPYTVRGTKQVPIDDSKKTSGSGLTTLAADSYANSIVGWLQGQTQNMVEYVLREHQVSKIKYFIICEIAGKKHMIYEIDYSRSKNPFNVQLKELGKWFADEFRIHGLKDPFKISGEVFCLEDDNMRHVTWSAGVRHEKDGFVFSKDRSESIPQREHLSDYLNLCFLGLNIKLPENLKSPADFFETKLLANQ